MIIAGKRSRRLRRCREHLKRPTPSLIAGALRSAPLSLTGHLVHSIAIAAQLIVAASVFYIWIFRFDNIVRDFEQFRYSPIFRNTVGVVKLVIATLMIVGIWMPAVVLGAALGMTALMVGAQWAHFSVSNPIAKRVPSALLLLLCLFVAAESLGMIG